MAKSTVSRALNGYSDIAESTRLRVSKTAQRMGYQPMVQAQAIRTGLMRSVGLVLNVGGSSSHRPFLTNFIDGISQRASQENWTLTVTTAQNSEAVLETIERLSNERKVDGFILPRTRVIDPRVDFLRTHGVPFVMFGRTGNDDECSWFDIKGELAIEKAVLRLVTLGHKRIGFINGLDRYMYASLRFDGYVQGLKKAGLAYDETLVRPNAVTKRDGLREGAVLLDLPAPPTAVVCAVDLAALGVYQAAKERGRKIGRDLSIISYDGIDEGEYASPPLTSFSVDNRAAGEILTGLLIKRIRGEAPETLRQLGEATLIERASDGPPVS
ncbi:LacI family transcriptional regulator [Cohaesibacter celericrescens]|uniref:LacI family transcriptional regulator n=3 Tax=Cohaesibacter celericrescens TaxID=2067669 RepID=A0A2N5XMH8_9HYPH|nr:LacI family transcriptional regulator [Cohaesibacter celericrescens]